MTVVPAVTVIVPTHGRPGAAARLVRALHIQRLPDAAGLEVVVVDDGSPVPVEVAADPGSHASVRVLRQRQAGPASARNRGLDAARGELVAFIDDDCEPAPGWLAALVEAARQHPGCGLGGAVVNRLRHNPFAETSQLIVSFLCEYYQDRTTNRFFTSNNLAFPRQALLACGGFDATYTRAAAEDREICDRWVERGGRLVAVPQAVVLHAHPLTWLGFLRQHFEYGRGAWGYRMARAARLGTGVRIEPWTFYRDLVAYPLRAHGWRGLPLAALVVLAQAANATGFLAAALRARLA
jgi:glycosyltransferase involved in cell wall biosynthesis